MKGIKWIKSGLIATLSFSFLMMGSPVKAAAPDLEAEAAILVEAETGKILYDENIDVILPPASMTKIMTEYLVHEAIDEGEISWEDEVHISDAVRQLSLDTSLSNVPLRQDEVYTVKELYEAMAIYSANAATVALAEHIAGSEANFVERMNAKAEEIGMEDYKFVNSSGLNNQSMKGHHPEGTGADEENMMSARATAILAYHLLNEYPEVLDTASIRTKTFKEGTEDYIEMENWNWMLPGSVFEYEGVDGLKTGYTDLAGNAFTSTAERDGLRLISVVMRTESREARFRETAKLLDYGFNDFEYVNVIEKGESVKGHETIPVSKGKVDEVSVSAGEDLSVLLEKGNEEGVSPVVTINEDLLNEDGEIEAPMEEGEVIGTIGVAYEEDVSYLQKELEAAHHIPLVLDEPVEKAGWFSLTIRSIGSFFGSVWDQAANFVKGIF